MEAAILLLPALFKEDPGLLFEVEVSHEKLTTVCETQSNQSTTLIAHFLIRRISMQTFIVVFLLLLVYTNYAIKLTSLFIFSSWPKEFEQLFDSSSN